MAKASLSSTLGRLSGTLGEQVYVLKDGRIVVRQKPTFRMRPTDNQRTSNEQFRAAADAWNAMTRAEVEEWNAYARSLTRHDPETGAAYHPTGQNVFLGLARKWLQMHPGEPLSLAPPTASFIGDGIAIAVAGGTGQATFTASAPNSDGTWTELLAQRLANERRAPSQAYRSQGFTVFAPGALSHAIALDPGWYALAYRFANPATGQATEAAPVAVVEVG